jgi:hypothetical protein
VPGRGLADVPGSLLGHACHPVASPGSKKQYCLDGTLLSP